MGKKTKRIYLDTFEYDNLLGTIEDMTETLREEHRHASKMVKRVENVLGKERVSTYSIGLATIETDIDLLHKIHKSMRYSARRGTLEMNKDLYSILKDMTKRYVSSRIEENESGDLYTALAEQSSNLDIVDLLD